MRLVGVFAVVGGTSSSTATVVGPASGAGITRGWRRFARNKDAVFGLAVFVAVVAMAVFAGTGPRQAEVIQAQLAKIGIKVKIELADFPTVRRRPRLQPLASGASYAALWKMMPSV